MNVLAGRVPVLAVTSVAVGVLAVLAAFWIPTAALVLGIVALVLGALCSRRTATGDRTLGRLGAGLGAAAVVAALAVVVLTTTPAPAGAS